MPAILLRKQERTNMSSQLSSGCASEFPKNRESEGCSLLESDDAEALPSRSSELGSEVKMKATDILSLGEKIEALSDKKEVGSLRVMHYFRPKMAVVTGERSRK
jgi:hypothetical protein